MSCLYIDASRDRLSVGIEVDPTGSRTMRLRGVMMRCYSSRSDRCALSLGSR